MRSRLRAGLRWPLRPGPGSRGLGRSAALHLAKLGAKPVMVDLLDESAGVARQIRESMSDIVWSIDPRRHAISHGAAQIRPQIEASGLGRRATA